MATASNRLEDYEEAIENLLGEIREYQSAGATLRDIGTTLDRIHEGYMVVGRTMNEVARDASETLTSIRKLKLEDIEARMAASYSAHQASLEQLSAEVANAVREQQRLGLEMLQHTTASQKQFDAFVGESQRSANALNTRVNSIEHSLAQLSSMSDARHEHLTKHVARLQILLVVVILLILAAGAFVYFQ